ncbi:hypothetical protein GF382_02465 [Candidatus Falkowbacteria bacterium]|nr:hypothetical protein [Candidatus Falkowbacteria bacterium]
MVILGRSQGCQVLFGLAEDQPWNNIEIVLYCGQEIKATMAVAQDVFYELFGSEVKDLFEEVSEIRARELSESKKILILKNYKAAQKGRICVRDHNLCFSFNEDDFILPLDHRVVKAAKTLLQKELESYNGQA